MSQMMRSAIIDGSHIEGVTEVKRRAEAEAEEVQILEKDREDKILNVGNLRVTGTETLVARNGGA